MGPRHHIKKEIAWYKKHSLVTFYDIWPWNAVKYNHEKTLDIIGQKYMIRSPTLTEISQLSQYNLPAMTTS